MSRPSELIPASPPFRPKFELFGAEPPPRLAEHDCLCKSDDGITRCLDADAAPVPASTGRIKLWDMPHGVHCSIIGTCFTTAELRKVVARFTRSPVDRLSDLEVHEAAVEVAARADEGGRHLHKALDARHQVAIAQFDRAKTADEVLTLWADARKKGDIPGAYWAAVTHRSASIRVFETVYGEVHMLSHLVGAANRADIRRLAELDAQNAALIDTLDKQTAQLHEARSARDDARRRLTEFTTLRLVPASAPPAAIAEAEADMARQLARLRDDLAVERLRREKAEHQLQAARRMAQAMEEPQRGERATLAALHAELDAAELHLTDAGAATPAPAVPQTLQGVTLLYVGGRPGLIQILRPLVAAAGGTLLHHDGGVEQRKSVLATEVAKADCVFFPVDCISHDAVNLLKRCCAQIDTPFRPLRTASVACFVAALRTGIEPSLAPRAT